MRVNGMWGPYTSLFTNSQSATSSVGIMLPDGMRNASTRNVRMTRKIAKVPRSARAPSHQPPEDAEAGRRAPPPRLGARPERTSATTLREEREEEATTWRREETARNG